jgi:hypothetical protein
MIMCVKTIPRQIDKGDKTVKMQRKKADKRRKNGIKGMSVTDRWLGRQREHRPSFCAIPILRLPLSLNSDTSVYVQNRSAGSKLTYGMRNGAR